MRARELRLRTVEADGLSRPAPRSCLYTGRVVHQRLQPKRYRLRKRVTLLFVDLDELAELDRRLNTFSYNARNLISVFECDLGDGSGRPLKTQALAHLERAGIDVDGGSIWLLCSPRILNTVFNPLSVYFCFCRNGRLKALLYEVTNTFKERYTYVQPANAEPGRSVHQAFDKGFRVSPFIPADARYRIRMSAPDDQLKIIIEVLDARERLMVASLMGSRRTLTDFGLIKAFVGNPLATLTTRGATHWHALRLWAKGVPIVDRGET